MTRIALVFFVLLAACGERIVYVYPDGSTPEGDAGTPADRDGAVLPGDDAGEPVDAWRPPVGTCEPDRVTGEVGHTDCRPTPATPICDAIAERCVDLPMDYCGACETDDQCANFDLQARCVFIPGDAEFNNDSACLAPCESDTDCAFLAGTPGWTSTNAHCFALPQGSFCVPDNAGIPHCRGAGGVRI